jgi:hypothetical protein
MDRAAVVEPTLQSMPASVARCTRRLLAEPNLRSVPPLTKAELAAATTEADDSLDPCAAMVLTAMAARIASAVCTARLSLPRESSDIDVCGRARQLFDGTSVVRTTGSFDGRAQRWLGLEAGWRSIKEERNAIMARACALLCPDSYLPRSAGERGNGVDQFDLAIGAAGGYVLSVGARAGLRRAVRDNLVIP